MSARTNILARIRAARQGQDQDRAAELAGIEDYLARGVRGAMPYAISDRVDTFCSRSRALGSTLEVVDGQTAVPLAVARYLAERSPPPGVERWSGAVWPALADWGWSGAGLVLEPRGAHPTDPLGVTGAVCGIAETGTLVLVAGTDTPPSVSLLPETHVAVLPRSALVDRLEDVWARLGELGLGGASALNLVSGPSRTADIEQTVVLGAHGPRRVHIILY